MNELLQLRLDGISRAQTRARLALTVNTLASSAILAGLWNEYLSWERQWAHTPKRSDHWGQAELLTAQIRAWLESQSIGISLLGIRLSISDASVLGALTLCFLAFWYCMCLRLANREIGTLLDDARELSLSERKLAYYGIRPHMVLMPASLRDDKVYGLGLGAQRAASIRFAALVVSGLNFMPFATVVITAISDLYFVCLFHSPWRQNEGAVWNELDEVMKTQFVVTMVFSLAAAWLTFSYCRLADKYGKGSQCAVDDFGASLGELS